MRILMITDFYHPFVGGVEQHVRTLSAALVERGHKVAVATLGNEDLPPFELDGGVRVHRVRGSAQRMARLFSYPDRPWAPPISDPELTLSLKRIIGQEQPEVVHGHDWLVRSFLPLKRWSKAKLAISLHYYTLTCAKKSLWIDGDLCEGPGRVKCARCALDHYGLAKGVPTLFGNWAGSTSERNMVDMFLPVSHATAQGNGLVNSKWPFRVIPNFVPADANAPVGDVEPFVSQLPEDGFLLFVGDPRPEKGLHVLLKAYAELNNAPPLVLIGKVWRDGQGIIPENVIALENWPNYAIMEAWRRSTIALAPSIWPEPCATVVIEAMVSGRPVIASRIGGMPDIVVDGETGVLVPANDPAALSSAIERLLSNPELSEALGQAGKQRSREFKVDVVVPKIESVYAQLVGNIAPATQTLVTVPAVSASSVATGHRGIEDDA